MKTLLGALTACLLIASSARALAPGDVPPAIDMPDLNNQKVDWASLEGKVVLLDFWASWCGPCKEAMPVLEALSRKYAAQGLVIIGVNIDSSRKKMSKFLKTMPVSFRIVHDRKLVIANRYEPDTMPTSYFIGRDGKIRYVHQGFEKGDAAGIEARLKALLAEQLRP